MKRNETREERALRRRERLAAALAVLALAACAAIILCIGTRAECGGAERLPAATEGFVLLGVGSAVQVLMRLLLWLDTGRRA